jgi:hypothetical protein
VSTGPKCGGCHAPINPRQKKCAACGWILHGSAFDVLERDDVPPRQRQAIELELKATAQTGPQRPGESKEAYQARWMAKLEELVEEHRDEIPNDD